MPTCLRVHFSGQVQGVGFRQTTRSLARQFAVAGYVRNLPDGRVELVAEGEADEVQRFLDAVAAEMDGFWRSKTQETLDPLGLTSFDVRR